MSYGCGGTERPPLHPDAPCLFLVHETCPHLHPHLKRRRAVEVNVWIWAPLWKAGSVTSAGGGGEDKRTKYPSPCPAPFPSLVLGRCSSPGAPPHSSRPASGPPRCAASALPSTALALCPSPFPFPSPTGNADLCPRRGTSFAGAWSWTGQLVAQTVGGGATGSGRLAGKIPLKYTKHNTHTSTT